MTGEGRRLDPPLALEPPGGNLYRPHPLQINSGTFWRCAHNSTGFAEGLKWVGCKPCAESDPESFRRFCGDAVSS